MTFRFGSWNVNGRRLKTGHVDLLRSADCDVLALQEVSTGFHAQLAAQSLFEWSVSSLSLRPPAAHEGRARRLGCSLFGRLPFSAVSSELLAHLAFPERALVVRAGSAAGAITICSFHAPPGASWGQIKPRTLKAIAEWLAGQGGTLVFGIDANTPKTDHPNPVENDWWWDEEPLLLGPKPVHRFHDALRLFLERRPEMMAAIRAERPHGPLAVSHFRGRGDRRTGCRYDFIYVSTDLMVEDVTYLHKEALEAGSDHALVVVQLDR
jgi:exonuclease III